MEMITNANVNVMKFNQLAMDMCQLYENKNNDYGDSFNISCTKYGPIAALTRMSDKFNRIETLTLKREEQKVEDEKLEDTLIDLANYAMMTVLWLRDNAPIDVNVDSQKVE